MNLLSCQFCEKTIKGSKINGHFCSARCSYAFSSKHTRESAKSQFGTSPGTSGAMSELAVSVDLLQKGYEVFRSISPNSRCDLIAWKNSTLLKIEVRTASLNLKTKKVSYTKYKVEHPAFDHYAIVLWGNGISQISYEPTLPDSG
jgi:hypothetical protein